MPRVACTNRLIERRGCVITGDYLTMKFPIGVIKVLTLPPVQTRQLTSERGTRFREPLNISWALARMHWMMAAGLVVQQVPTIRNLHAYDPKILALAVSVLILAAFTATKLPTRSRKPSASVENE